MVAKAALTDVACATLDTVKADHHIIAVMMDTLEREVVSLETDDIFDLDLVRLVLRYMAEYPDRFHHPREEALFRRATLHDPGFSLLATKIHMEHIVMPNATHELGRVLDAVALGQIQDRQAVLTSLKTYTARQRRHSLTEEAELYPRMAALLTAEDAAAVDREIAQALDPLHGGRDPGPYLRLKEVVLAAAA